MTPLAWQVDHLTGTAAELHAREPAPPPAGGAARAVWVSRVAAPALVLGSAQPRGHVDGAEADARGVEVARRRSGGGGVLLVPGEVVWVDVLVGAGDPLWQDDVGRATWWLGEAWAATLHQLGVAHAEVHRGPLVRSAWSSRACFAGLGPGEVTVAGRKVVGISQRRARGVARLQVAVLLRWDAPALAALLGGAVAEPPPAAGLLDAAAVGLDRLLGRPVAPDAVERAFLAQLRRCS